MIRYNYEIQSKWPGRPQSAAHVGAKFLTTLDALDSIDPVFGDWGTVEDEEAMTLQPVDSLRSDFTPFVESQVWRDDFDEPDPDSGYLLWATSHAPVTSPASPTTMTFLSSAGSRWRNDASLTAGSSYVPPDSSIVTYPIFKAALLTLVSIWSPTWANARCSRWQQKPPLEAGERLLPVGLFQVPWLSYLCAERAAGIDPPGDILSERTPDGGLLMIAAETRFDPANSQHMARAKVMADIMNDHSGES